ncbi:GH25 family lysozyme M1 (1,4-beta-N-acetylmuramidase), partial [Arthrobacter sp. UYCu511]
MFSTRSRFSSLPGCRPSGRARPIVIAGLLTMSLVLSLGVVPAHAESTPAPADPSAQAVTTAVPQTATSTTPVSPAPSAIPLSSPESSPTPSSAVDAPYGAYMGMGLAKDTSAQQPKGTTTTNSQPFAAQPLSAAIPAGVLGMDVSGWQADSATHSISQVSWTEQWRLGARFVYVKASEGNTFRDASFSSHYSGASKVGMLRGGYHFALPNQSSAVSQADFFVDNGGGWSADGKTLPPLLDIENNPYGANCYGLNPNQMVSWISAFSQRILDRTGRLPMIYTNYYWWQDCTSNSTAFTNHPLHIAAYGATNPWVPGAWKNYSVWQYSDSGPFAGDSNTWNGTQSSLNEFAANAGAPVAPTPTPVRKPSIASAADLVAADSSGALWNYPANGSGAFGTRRQIGQGWTSMRSITVIDWNSDGVLDLLAQRKTGSLAFYPGLPGGGFSGPRTLAASGWSGHQLAVGYWLNSSKYPQILTRGGNGDLSLWTNSSGNALGTPKRIAQGWNGINLTMLDYDGDGRQDLMAQYPDGTLRLARSNGSGGLLNEPRRTIGTGWNAFTSVSVYSDFTSPGSTGLIRRTTAGAISYIPVLGNSSFGPASSIGSGWSSFLIAGGENINQPPLAPPAPKAVPGNGRAVVTVAKNINGAAATSVSITATPGGASCSLATAAGTCTVPGLTNGTTYTFRAAAKNAGGTSSMSTASSAIVPSAPVHRIAGTDRYATSAAISKATFANGVGTVYIASGTTYPDALSGAAAAGTLNGPVLLATPTGLPAATKTELSRLKPKRIIILGGTGAFNNTVQTQLTAYSSTVIRIAGTDRYATSAAISKATFATGVGTVYIASGTTYPDALSGAAAAGTLNGPVLLATPTGLPAATKTELS